MRFSYLQDIVHYLYYLVRVHLFERQGDLASAKQSYLRAKRYAIALEHNTEAVKPTTRFDLYDNGLKASWCEKAFLRCKAIYENE